MKQLFNNDWSFSKQPLESSFDQIANFDWQKIDIPHDWLIYQTQDLYETSVGWYKKSFELAEFDADKEFSALRFDGVYMDSTVYLNGKVVGVWKYGYSTFEFDITDFLTTGTNELVVSVVHDTPNSRWYSGAGIYRNVHFISKSQTRFVSDGIYITPKKMNQNEWIVDVDTELIANTGSKLVHTIIDDTTGEIVSANEDAIDVDGMQVRACQMSVSNPKIWDVYQGNLYTIKSEIIVNNIVVDSSISKFGFRTIEMSPTGGFAINGRRIKLFGVCQHHDLGALGAAMNKAALRRQFEVLKEMGVNAIRTAHNMPAVEVMELADELGFLICSESFDMWEMTKTPKDYGRFFKEWAEIDVATWVRRDRNSPSLIMWCIGNEIYDTHASEHGQVITRNLKRWVEEHDPKGHAPVTIGSNFLQLDNARKCTDIVKYAGYNYAQRLYDEQHEKYPDWIIYGSETSSTVQSRGVYKFPLAQQFLADDDEQCSALGNTTVSWGAKNTEDCIISDRDVPYSLGQFIWTGFDYIGEPTPYHTKNSYYGQVDTAGFKKDSAYIYQAEWTSYKTAPMVHIFPYWDFSPGEIIDVRVCSNAPKIELFFNDESVGIHHIDHEKGHDLVGHWQIPYSIGTLRAVAYDETDAIIATDIQTSFGDATKIRLTPNKQELLADGTDIIFVEIEMIDEENNVVANANNRVNVAVTGSGRLVGLDNGDSTDYDAYKGTSRRLFSGKLLAMIAATDQAGEIEVTVESIGLPTEKLVLNALATEIPKGVSTTWISNEQSIPNNEIPIRKIELRSEGKKILDQDKNSVIVEAILRPINATYNDLEWRLTNRAGIDTNIASFEILENNKVKVTALGDGEFYLRAQVKNGSDKPRIITQMTFSATGLGLANLDPYEFISGGLYSKTNDELGNGNGRGVVTKGGFDHEIIFDNVDFGEVGADTITLPVFVMGSGPVKIQIWEGVPNQDGSDLITTVDYTLETIWDTYQSMTYKLPRRLVGNTTISFVVHDKIQFKGFEFEKIAKAYDKISSLKHSYLSGDTYEIVENAVEKIGNNVSIQFDEMNFTEGANRIRITGSTPLEANMIRIEFNDGSNRTSQMVEFKQASEYEVQEFEIEEISGNQTVTFIFLPGCNFNFKTFQFIK